MFPRGQKAYPDSVGVFLACIGVQSEGAVVYQLWVHNQTHVQMSISHGENKSLCSKIILQSVCTPVSRQLCNTAAEALTAQFGRLLASRLWFIPKVLIIFVRTLFVHHKPTIKIFQLEFLARQGIIILFWQCPSPCTLIIL